MKTRAWILIAAFAIGCGTHSTTTLKTSAKAEHKHDGWWCDEHALPEEVCDLCSKKYRDAEKSKGNWCEHDRVKTSCFQCNPGLKEKYSKEYEARFGKKPPETEK